jgi:hypothetical protein
MKHDREAFDHLVQVKAPNINPLRKPLELVSRKRCPRYGPPFGCDFGRF